jgi:hypothetical protein
MAENNNEQNATAEPPLAGTPLNGGSRIVWKRERMLQFNEAVYATINAMAVGTRYVRIDVGAEGALLIDDWCEQLEALSPNEVRLLSELASDPALRGLIIQQIGGASYRNHQPAKPVMSITRMFLLVTGVLTTTLSVREMIKRLGLKGISRRVLYCFSVMWLLLLNVYRNLLRTGEHILVTREYPTHELTLRGLISGYLKNAISNAVTTSAKLVANGSGFMQLAAFGDDAGVFFRSLLTSVTNVTDKRADLLRYIALLRFCLKTDRIPQYLTGDPVLKYIRHDLTFITVALDDSIAGLLPNPPLKPSLELQFTHNELVKLFQLPGVFIERLPFAQYLGLNHRLVKSKTNRHMGLNQGVFLTKAVGAVDTHSPAFTVAVADGQLDPTVHEGATVILSDLRGGLVGTYGYDVTSKAWASQTPKSPVIVVRNRLPQSAFLLMALGVGADVTVYSSDQDLRGYAIQSTALIPVIMKSRTSLKAGLRKDAAGLLHDGVSTTEILAVNRILCGRQEAGSQFECPNLGVAMLLGLPPGTGTPLRPADEPANTIVTPDTLIQPSTLTVTDIERSNDVVLSFPHRGDSTSVRRVSVTAPLAYLIGRSLGLGGIHNSQYILRRYAVYESLESGLMLEAMRLADLSAKEGGLRTYLEEESNRNRVLQGLTPAAVIGISTNVLRILADEGLTSLFAQDHEGSLMLAVTLAVTAYLLCNMEGQDPWLVRYGICRHEFLTNPLMAIGAARRALEGVA